MYRLRQLRTERGMTLRELTKQTGIDHTTLYHAEVGKRHLTVKRAWLLADFFGVTIDYLVGRTDK